VTGYGVVGEESDAGRRRIYLIGAGSIKASGRLPLPKRLRQIFEGLSQVIVEFQPDAVAVENTFLSNNFATALKLGQACGVALLAAELSGLEVYEYTPAVIKLAVVGHGTAEKQQVQHMVDYLLGSKAMEKDPASGLASAGSGCGGIGGQRPHGPPHKIDGSHHATDALAVAICHLHSKNLQAVVLSRSRVR
jgi:crossover junction endodeoxyribonuclease RuvC